jgi:Family of unknown function (DUF5681)
MSDEDDQSDNERVGSSEYLVGYKKPPPQHRFQKCRSGNPRGRPRQRGKRADASVLDSQALMLHEAYRLVSIREGDVSWPPSPAIRSPYGGTREAQVSEDGIVEALFEVDRAEKRRPSTPTDMAAVMR